MPLWGERDGTATCNRAGRLRARPGGCPAGSVYEIMGERAFRRLLAHVIKHQGDKTMKITDTADLNRLAQTPLFSYFSPEEISDATEAIHCYIKTYRRNEIMMHSGDSTNTSGLILRGRAKILTAPNLDGNQKIISVINMGEMYGEPFNCLSYSAVPITVVSATEVRVLVIDLTTLFTAQCAPPIAQRLLANLAIQFAEKIIVFRNKIEVLSQPTLKLKILMTIKQYAEYQNTLTPNIPFSKVEWAEYLCVNRNSIARGLEELQEEGEIRIVGSNYQLLKPEYMMFFQRSGRSPHNAVHAAVSTQSGLFSQMAADPAPASG